MLENKTNDIIIRHTHKREYDVYFCDIPSAKSKREAEHEAVMHLVREVFGEEAELCHTEDGAPYIKGSDIHISVSHSKHTACLAVSTAFVIGVDVEEVAPRILNVVEKILPNETKRPSELQQQDYIRLLTKCWCTKEAVFKAEGETAGLLGENVDIDLSDLSGKKCIVRTCLFEYRMEEIPLNTINDEVCMVALQEDMERFDVLEHIARKQEKREKMLAVLLDPEKCSDDDLDKIKENCSEYHPDLFLVGGSTMSTSLDGFVKRLRSRNMQVPIVLFPGSGTQLSDYADGIFFLSLLSGRNAECLIGQQVKAARQVWQSPLQVIPLAYILVDGGKQTAVARVSQTAPIPQDNIDLIVDTALAGYMLGMDFAYLEAGSGAEKPVGREVIEAVAAKNAGRLIVGGGITTVRQMTDAFDAGADIVVIGNYFEKHIEDIPEFCEAVTGYNNGR